VFTTLWHISNARSTTFLKNPRRNSVFVREHSQQHDTCILNVLERKTETPRRTVALACTLCYCPPPLPPPHTPVYPSFRPAGTPQTFPFLPTPRSITLCRRYTCNLHPNALREVQSTCEVKQSPKIVLFPLVTGVVKIHETF